MCGLAELSTRPHMRYRHGICAAIGGVTSQFSNTDWFFDECHLMVDDFDMDVSRHIYQHTCHMCDRPALTFNEGGEPLCSGHATIFVGVPRVEFMDDEYLIPVIVEASI